MSQSPTAPSSTLIRLLDLAIIPASILILTKILTILILNTVLGLSWDVKTFSDAFFGVQLTYANNDQLLMVISYSNLFMHLAALTGAMLALLKLFYLHPHHVRPSVVLKLAKSDQLHFIQSTFHLYNEAIVWSLFLLASDIVILINFVQDLTYSWIFGISMFSTLVLVFILVRSIDRDLFLRNSLKNIKYK